MAYRVLEVTLQSARELKNVNMLTRMEVYAVATISGDPITRQCTPPDPYGGRNPSWNAALRFTVPPTAAAATGCLHVLLRTERAFGDRDVGEVVVPLSELLAGTSARNPGPRPPQSGSYHVRKLHRAETRGVLHLSYRLGPVVAPQVHQPQPPTRAAAAAAVVDEPVVAYAVGRPFHPQPAYTYAPAMELPPSPPTPPGHAATPTLSPQAYGGHPAMPPPPQKAYGGHPTMPPTPQKTYGGHPTMPPTPQKAYGGHPTMPPPPQQSYGGHMAISPPPKAYGHFTTLPQRSYGGYVAMQAPQPKAYGQFSMPPPPATPPKTADRHVPSSPWKAKSNGDIDYGTELSGGMEYGMIADDMMMADAAAYNAGYRAGLASDWGKAASNY